MLKMRYSPTTILTWVTNLDAPSIGDGHQTIFMATYIHPVCMDFHGMGWDAQLQANMSCDQ